MSTSNMEDYGPDSFFLRPLSNIKSGTNGILTNITTAYTLVKNVLLQMNTV